MKSQTGSEVPFSEAKLTVLQLLPARSDTIATYLGVTRSSVRDIIGRLRDKGVGVVYDHTSNKFHRPIGGQDIESEDTMYAWSKSHQCLFHADVAKIYADGERYIVGLPEGIVETELNQTEEVELLYDPEANIVAFKPSEPGENTYSLTQRGRKYTVNCHKLLDYMGLSVNPPQAVHGYWNADKGQFDIHIPQHPVDRVIPTPESLEMRATASTAQPAANP